MTTSRAFVLGAAMLGCLLATGCSSAGDGGAARTLTPTTAPVDQPVDAQPPPHAARTLVDLRGNGIKKSKRFTTSGDFEITYSFDCSSFGYKGNFIIDVAGDDTDVAVNELAKKGSDTVPEYLAPGSYYLDMNSECSWHVVVRG